MSEQLVTDAQSQVKSEDVDVLLAVDGLRIVFGSERNPVEVVHDVSFEVRRGETLGLVGESGSGKTMTSLAIMGLVPTLGGRLTAGTVHFDGRDMTGLREPEWLRVRGRRIGMIFQEPTRSLDPAFTVGDQIAESLRVHMRLPRREAWRQAAELLGRVGITHALKRAHDYPHMFSGGMCQRVMIAMAIACGPDLLIADEPTTALDVTLQAKVLDLLRELRDERRLSILYISHDLGVVSEFCDRAAVMYAGQIVEVAPIREVFRGPRHPYTQGLLNSIPKPGAGKRMTAIPGQVPPPAAMPSGCRFHPRCVHADPLRCAAEMPELVETGPGHVARCLFAATIDLPGVGSR